MSHDSLIAFRSLPRHARAAAGVALLAIRAAIRSRVVLTLLLVLVAGMLGLPHLVTGDGTPASVMQVSLRYTLTFCAGVLGLATLWASCAAFGAEIDSKRIELTAVKPVPAFVLWIGRWLGILAMDAALLLLVMAGIRAQLGCAWTETGNPALLSRAVVRPVMRNPDAEARETLENLRRAHQLSEAISETTALRKIRKGIPNRYSIIHPGETAAWTFVMDHPLNPDGRFWLRLRFDSGNLAMPVVQGVCRLRKAGDQTWPVEIAVDDSTRNELNFPVSSVQLAGAKMLELVFVHQAKPDAPALLIQSRRGVSILTPEGSFTGNLARVLVVYLGILAVLAALGLTLGACFSFPVAAFAATAIVLTILAAADSISDVDLDNPSLAGWRQAVNRVSSIVVRQVDYFTNPLLAPEPLTQAVAGERVPAADLWRVALWGGFIYPLVLAITASAVLRRREPRP